MEKNILTEINRFKELMNLLIIKEGREDLVSDVVNSAKKLFSNATPNSVEDIFNKNIINATTDTEIKKILASDPKLARKVLKQAIVDSGDKFFMDVEGRILYYIELGMSSSKIKNKVKGFFDKHVGGDLKDEYLNTYYQSINLLSSGRKTANEVFGRDVKPFQPKNKPTPETNIEKYRKGFKQGWDSPNILGITVKKIWKSKIRGITAEKLNNEDWKRLASWVFTGSNRLPKEIIKDFQKLGFGPGVASFGGEVMKRWWYLFKNLTLLNFTLQLIIDFSDSDVEYGPEWSDVGVIIDRIRRAWAIPDINWALPMFITWEYAGKFYQEILDPLARGSSISDIISGIKQRIENITPEVEELIDKSKENVSESVGEKGLRLFLKSKGKEYEPNSFKPKEDNYPAEGMDTEGNLYYFENNKWSLVK